MTLHRQANHYSHYCFSPALGRMVAACIRRLRGYHKSCFGHSSLGIVMQLCPHNGEVHACAHHRAFVFQNEAPSCDLNVSARKAAQHCAAVLQVRSRVLCLVGIVASWEPNQQRERCRRQGERREIYFPDIWGEKIFPLSGASASHCSASTSPASRSRSVSALIRTSSPTAPFASPISTSRARRRLPMKRSWSCSTSCVRGSGHESQAKEPKANARSAVATSGRLAMGSSRPVTGRSVTATSERMDVTGGESAAQNSCVGGAAVARQSHKLKVAGSIPAPATSSGDGLGFHQPGSMTRGFASLRQPPSGRARDRATCPAVARFIDGRAA